MITRGEVEEAKKRAVGGARKRCRKGKSCSAACIAGIKVCLVNIQSAVSNVIPKVVGFLNKGNSDDKKMPEKEPLPKGGYRVRSSPPALKDSLAGKSGLPKAFKGQSAKNLTEELLKDMMSTMPTTPLSKIREIAAAQLKNNVEFADRLERNLPKGVKANVFFNIVQIVGRTESGDKVEVHYSPKIGFHFRVNDTEDVGTVKTPEGKVQVTSMVRSLYGATIRSLPVGSVLMTRAHTKDILGGERRATIYNRLGFSLPKEVGGDMYAIVGPGNIVSPSTKDEFDRQRNNPSSVSFSETYDSCPIGSVEDWYTLIF